MGKHLTLLFLIAIFSGVFIYVGSKKEETRENLEKASHITGKAGTLRIVDTNKDEMFGRIITLNDIMILSNDHVGFEYAYPSSKNPEIVIAWGDCGGSACGAPSSALVDLGSEQKPTFTAQIDELLADNIQIKKISTDSFKIKGTSTYLRNSLGDALELEMIYNRKGQTLHFLPKHGAYDYSAFNQKHPEELMSHPEAREIFLRQMKPSDFKLFRESIAVSSAIESKNHGRFVIGSGMAPHSGGDPSSFFVIDNLTNQFIGGIYQNGQIRIFSDMAMDDLDYSVVSELNALLLTYNTEWDFESSKPIPAKPRR